MKVTVFPAVHQAVMITCSHLPPGDGDDASAVGLEERKREGHRGGEEGKREWHGVSDEVVTYKSFLPMWRTILSPLLASKIKIPGHHYDNYTQHII